MKNVPRSERHLCFSHYSNYQYFPLLYSISIPISISKFPKKSISISKSIFWRCKFQYQYQNQYFEIVIFNIKININTSKILTFQNFSKFCAMSADEQQSQIALRICLEYQIFIIVWGIWVSKYLARVTSDQVTPIWAKNRLKIVWIVWKARQQCKQKVVCSFFHLRKILFIMNIFCISSSVDKI